MTEICYISPVALGENWVFFSGLDCCTERNTRLAIHATLLVRSSYPSMWAEHSRNQGARVMV